MKTVKMNIPNNISFDQMDGFLPNLQTLFGEDLVYKFGDLDLIFQG